MRMADRNSVKMYTESGPELPFVVTTLGSNSRQPVQLRPNGFESHHVIWVEKGAGTFCAGGEQFTLREGEGFFCRAGVPHEYRAFAPPFSTAWITFDCGDSLLDYFDAPDYFRFAVTPQFLADIKELSELFRSGTPLSRSAAGYSWCTGWLQSVLGTVPDTATRVLRFIENEYARPVTLDDVSEHVGMSKFALCRYYRAKTGVTVMDQLRRVRIANAKRFLRLLPLKSEEIGRMCGFENASYFCKLFKAETGLTPNQYRSEKTE